jgi:hypothetical protein
MAFGCIGYQPSVRFSEYICRPWAGSVPMQSAPRAIFFEWNAPLLHFLRREPFPNADGGLRNGTCISALM